jgi:hypothetical protein
MFCDTEFNSGEFYCATTMNKSLFQMLLDYKQEQCLVPELQGLMGAPAFSTRRYAYIHMSSR